MLNVTQKLVYKEKIFDCKNRDTQTKTWAPNAVQVKTTLENFLKIFFLSTLAPEMPYLHKSFFL